MLLTFTHEATMAKKKKEADTCPHCGRLMRDYNRKVTLSQLAVLRRLKDVGTMPVEVAKRFNLNRTQSATFNMLKYHGLIAPCLTQKGTKRAGWWRITDLGVSFAEDAVAIQESAIVYMNKVVRKEGPMIFAHQVKERDRKKPHHVAMSRPHVQVGAATSPPAG